MGLFNIFSRDLGIDLGTANTLVKPEEKVFFCVNLQCCYTQ